jgi:fructoselysine transporter
LLFLGGLGFVFSLLLRLGDAIDAILAMRILTQFVAQALGVVLLRKKFGTKDLPFKMRFYPLPVILSILIWIFAFLSTGWFALWGSLIAIAGVIVYYVKERRRHQPSAISH